MWFILLINLINSVAAQQTFINVYRLDFGMILIGIWEIALVVGTLAAILQGGKYAQRFPTSRLHPALMWIYILLGLGLFFGAIGAMIYGTPMKYALSSAREYGSWIIYIYIGYRLFPRPKSAITFAYCLTLCGIMTSMILMWHFGENAQKAGSRNNITLVRTAEYVTGYASLTWPLLVFAIISRQKLFPTPISALIAAFCLVGQWTPLHRGEWLTSGFCFVALISALPRQRRLSVVLRLLLVLPLLFGAIYAGISVASSLTHRDFFTKINQRMDTLLPWRPNPVGQEKAWEGRLEGVSFELEIWRKNPLMGRGFGAQEAAMISEGEVEWAANHNGWSSLLAKCGIFGLLGSVLVWTSMIVIGRKLMRTGADRGSVLMGFMCFIAGVALFVGIASTMFWVLRSAMLFGTICGMAFKCLDQQETARALQEQEQWDQEFVPAEAWAGAPEMAPMEYEPYHATYN